MDPRLVEDCAIAADTFLRIYDTSKPLDPTAAAQAFAAIFGAQGWIRKRRATVESDEIDPQAVLDRVPSVFATASEVVEREPESGGGS
jgi:hypothetical protein